jgi:hypothetical protein
MAQVTAIPTGEGPVFHDLGIHHHLDEDIEEGDALELLELIVTDLA